MCLQIISLFVSKIGVFGHFLEIPSLDFANFAYYIRQEWYLADPVGFSRQKKYFGLIGPDKACLQIIFCLQIHFFDLNSFVISNFAYYDRLEWYLVDPGDFSCQKNFSPNRDLSPNYFLSPNSFFRLKLVCYF